MLLKVVGPDLPPPPPQTQGDISLSLSLFPPGVMLGWFLLLLSSPLKTRGFCLSQYASDLCSHELCYSDDLLHPGFPTVLPSLEEGGRGKKLAE